MTSTGDARYWCVTTPGREHVRPSPPPRRRPHLRRPRRHRPRPRSPAARAGRGRDARLLGHPDHREGQDRPGQRTAVHGRAPTSTSPTASAPHTRRPRSSPPTGSGAARTTATRPPSARASSTRATWCSPTPGSASAPPPARSRSTTRSTTARRAADGRRPRRHPRLHARRRPGTTGRIGYVSQETAGDPRVGMIGGSYGGQIQYAVAVAGPADRRDRPDHHLERPLLLAGAEQHRPVQRRHLPHARRREEGVGRPVLRRRHRLRRAERDDRPGDHWPAARTS